MINPPPQVGSNTSATKTPNGAMSANVVRYRSDAFLSSVMYHQPSWLSPNCEHPKGGSEVAPLLRAKSIHFPSAACSPSWPLPPAKLKNTFSLAFATMFTLALGCGGVSTPNPSVAVGDFSGAVQRKDARAVHAMLDEASRRRVTVEEVHVLLERDGPEIVRRMNESASLEVRVRADAVLAGGERVALNQESDQFRVSESSTLMGFAVTPHEALTGLRRALEHPDYAMLLQLLSSDVREQVESHRKALVRALSDLGAVEVVVEAERAVVNTADGHRVELELESGVWRVSDFE
jgi:hypothetical protein